MSVSDEELPNYSDVGELGEPPRYQNTESAAGHRTHQPNAKPVFEDDDLPPTYESIYGQIKEEWMTSDNLIDFLKKAGAICLASLACTLILLVLLILPIAYIVIGAMYIDECPINRWIPIYLIVAGILGLTQNGLMLLRKQVPNNAMCSISYRVYEITLAVISFIWFILGTIWVYSILTSVCFEKGARCYCNNVCYWFAFVMITITYVLIILLLVIMCFVCIFTLRWFDREQIEPAPPGDTQGETQGIFLGEETILNYNTLTTDGPPIIVTDNT